MDMDELFSQVDEKRKVSMKMNLFLILSVEHVAVCNCIHSISHFPDPLIRIIEGLLA